MNCPICGKKIKEKNRTGKHILYVCENCDTEVVEDEKEV